MIIHQYHNILLFFHFFFHSTDGTILLRDLKSKFGTLILVKKPLKIKEKKIHLQIGRTYIEGWLMGMAEFEKLRREKKSKHQNKQQQHPQQHPHPNQEHDYMNNPMENMNNNMDIEEKNIINGIRRTNRSKYRKFFTNS